MIRCDRIEYNEQRCHCEATHKCRGEYVCDFHKRGNIPTERIDACAIIHECICKFIKHTSHTSSMRYVYTKTVPEGLKEKYYSSSILCTWLPPSESLMEVLWRYWRMVNPKAGFICFETSMVSDICLTYDSFGPKLKFYNIMRPELVDDIIERSSLIEMGKKVLKIELHIRKEIFSMKKLPQTIDTHFLYV